MTLNELFTAIANQIRRIKGTSETIKAENFATEMSTITTGNLSDEEYAEANDDLDDILEGSTPTTIYPPDWSEIGYEDTPQTIIDAFNYAKEIKDNWDSSVEILDNKFMNDKELMTFPLVDTSNITNMAQAFYNSNLFSLPLLNTSKTDNFNMAFRNCLLVIIPPLDLSSGTNFSAMFAENKKLIEIPEFTFSSTFRYSISSMFSNCSSLKNVPLLDIKNAYDIRNMFYNCLLLTEESLNNIMGMCISATRYTGTKTLAYIGLSSTQAETCQTLSNYQAFLDAGWTTGY